MVCCRPFDRAWLAPANAALSKLRSAVARAAVLHAVARSAAALPALSLEALLTAVLQAHGTDDGVAAAVAAAAAAHAADPGVDALPVALRFVDGRPRGR